MHCVHVTPPVISRNRNGEVSLGTDAPVAPIHYTTDGSTPTVNSLVYQKPFGLFKGGMVKAIAIDSKRTSEASVQQFGLSKSGWKIVEAGQLQGRFAQNAIDESVSTLWSTLQRDTAAKFSETTLTIDLGKTEMLKSFSYLPRQDRKTAGIADAYEFWISENGTDWQQAATGEFSNIKANPVLKTVVLPKTYSARFVKFTATHVIDGNGVTIAEIGIND